MQRLEQTPIITKKGPDGIFCKNIPYIHITYTVGVAEKHENNKAISSLGVVKVSRFSSLLFSFRSTQKDDLQLAVKEERKLSPLLPHTFCRLEAVLQYSTIQYYSILSHSKLDNDTLSPILFQEMLLLGVI